MNRSLHALLRMLALTLALLVAPVAASANDTPLRTMTFNVRVPVEADGTNYWPHRRDLFIETIRKADPDIFGTQELKQEQGDYIIAHLPAFAWFGIDRQGAHQDEHMGIFYRHDRLTLLKAGNFWLSETPDVPGSISWGHPLPRMVSWGLFERKADGRRFYFYNTHFPYRDEDEDAREKAAQEIAERIGALPGDVPLILTGDFNTGPESRAHATLIQDLTDVRDAAPEKAGPERTFHNFTGTPDRRIDWILERGFTPLSVTTVTIHKGTHYPSDHFPVMALLGWDAGE